MDITQTTQTTQTTTPTKGAKPAISADFDTFLKMLTVQLTNQDPMNPIESTDYAVQLATFSGVEQQVRTNQLLTDMAAQNSLGTMAQLAGWVGQEARVSAPVRYDGSPVTLSPQPAPAASAATLIVRDAAGRVVAREEVPVSTAPYQWLGADAKGNPLPPGTYALTLESRAGDSVIKTAPVEHYARIAEARRGAAGIVLVTESGAEVAASDVTAIRRP